MNSLPKTVTRQRRDCDLNPGPSAPESSTLTTRLPSHPWYSGIVVSRIRCVDEVNPRRARLVIGSVIVFFSGGYTISVCKSTQPCIPAGSLNRVPASAGVKARMLPLPGGR